MGSCIRGYPSHKIPWPEAGNAHEAGRIAELGRSTEAPNSLLPKTDIPTSTGQPLQFF